MSSLLLEYSEKQESVFVASENRFFSRQGFCKTTTTAKLQGSEALAYNLFQLVKPTWYGFDRLFGGFVF